MSNEATINSVKTLNSELQFFYERGEPLLLEVDRKPALEVVSFEPLEYESYGRFLHRAPQVKGALALRGMLGEPHPIRGIRLYGLVSDENRGYGIEFDPRNGPDVVEVNRIAQYLGHKSPNFRLVA